MRESTIDIATRDGAIETLICHPERGDPHPAVLMLMDVPGTREKVRGTARRLASVGFRAMVPNLYCRAGRDTMFGPGVVERGEPGRDRMLAIRTRMTIPPVMGDVAPLPMVAQLQALFDVWGAEGEIGIHPAVHHGFAFPQRWCFDKPAGERHWERLISLYRRQL